MGGVVEGWRENADNCNSLTIKIKKTKTKNHATFARWNTAQQKERRSSYPLQQHGWKWGALC